MYYIFVENEKLTGAGQAKILNEDIKNIEVSEAIYTAYIDTPERYIYLDGEIIENSDYETEQEKKERERINLLSLTKREVFLALYKDKGLTPEQVRGSITDTEALIEFDYANEYYRGNPLIEQLGNQLGYTTAELDYLFENGKFEEKEEIAHQVRDDSEVLSDNG